MSVLAQTVSSPSPFGAPFLIGSAIGGAIFGLVASRIWSNKGGEAWVGFLWGFFLGLIGLIIVAIAKPRDYRGSKLTQDSVVWQQPWAQQPQQTGGMGAMGVMAAVPAATIQMRVCPNCGQQLAAELDTCPHCKQRSAPWRQEQGFWVTKDESGREWRLDAATNAWVPYRINKFCPHCKAEMTPDQGVCPECGQVSNALQYMT